MSLIEKVWNTSERTTFTESVAEDSTLDNNISLSKVNLSKLIVEGSAVETSTPKLSISLGQKTNETIPNNSKNKEASPVSRTENTRICTLENTANETGETTCRLDESTENFGDKDGEEESVIPVEDDDEISALDISGIEIPQKDMFSHLQPKPVNVLEYLNVDEKGEEDPYLSQDEINLFEHPFVEVGRRLWHSTAEKQMYTKGCLWSPDGTCLLVPVNFDGMHIVELPIDLYTLHELPSDREISDLSSAVHVKEGGTVYDYCWYPYMNSSDPTTCCWLATRQHEPIHMWDAFSGELRCSYRGYDEVDEVESAISVIFSNDAQKVIGGYKKTIKVFDTNMPGRDCVSINVKKAVSCFALTTDNDNCVTTGTWTGYINHYDLRAPKLGPLFTLGGHSGGITWLKYIPALNGNWYLFSGARKDSKILQWDMRNYTDPIQTFERNVQTNQRIYFDLTPLNTWMATGDTEGLLRIWNINNQNLEYELALHEDCCNGVSFHPSLPLISTSSGQYHFVDITESEEKSTKKIINYENSLLILWYGPTKENKD